MDKNELRQKYTATDVLNHFGISLNRSGFINCISHTDKNASCKVYRDNIHCFSCGVSHDIFGIYKELSNMHSGTFNELIASFCTDFGETYQVKTGHVKTSRSELDRQREIRFAKWRCRTEQARIADYRKRIYNGIESKQAEWVRACKQDRFCREWMENNWTIKDEIQEEYYERSARCSISGP